MGWFEDTIDNVIFGGAGQRNEAREDAYNANKKHNQDVADLTNKYNTEAAQAEHADYLKMRDFTHEIAMENHGYQVQLQDFDHLGALQAANKSLELGIEQVDLNRQAYNLGVKSEKRVLREQFLQSQYQQKQNFDALKQVYADAKLNRKEQYTQLRGIKDRQFFGSLSIENEMDSARTQTALQKQTAQINSLVAQGSSQLGQAGRSTQKAQQSNKAALHRGLLALNDQLSGRLRTAAIQLAELKSGTELAEIGVGINLKRIDNAIKNAESDAKFNNDVINSNLKSAIKQAKVDMKQLALQHDVANKNVVAGLISKPAQLPYPPVPKLPPERTYIPPMKVLPGFVAEPEKENMFTAAVDTIGGYVSTATSIATGYSAGKDAGWWGQQQQQPPT